MKTILSALAIAAASTALAVESSNTFGILRVDSSAEQTIVSVPWENAGGGAIKVKDVVKTANLTVGDQLYYYDATAQEPAYKMWALTENGWEGATTVANGITPTAGDEEDTLARGGALILVRSAPTKVVDGKTAANPFYLYGQYNSSQPSISVTRNASSVTYTLIAPPSANAVSLNDGTWAGVTSGDRVILPNGQPLYWKDSTDKWCALTTDLDTGDDTYTPYATPVPAGEGVWMRVQKGSGTVSVQW